MDYPLVNGTRYEWSSIEAKVAGDIVIGFKEINFDDSLEPTLVYGTHAQPMGRTRGVYKANADMTLYLDEANTLIQKLGAGFKETPFDITVAYSEGGATITAEIVGCRIKTNSVGNSQGADPSTMKFELSVMFVRWMGQESLASPLKGIPK